MKGSLLIGICLLLLGQALRSKDREPAASVNHLNPQDTSLPAIPADTVHIGTFYVIRSDSGILIGRDEALEKKKRMRNLQTKWLVFDIGFNNYVDKSKYSEAAGSAYLVRPFYINAQGNKDYSSYSADALNTIAPRSNGQSVTPSDFALITGKSINVNIWVFMQKLNVIRHKLNLVYAFGVEMNNYRYARNITYQPGYPTVIIRDTVNFKKNKLFAEYLTLPLMLNFTSHPFSPGKSFSCSLGMSGGYLIRSRTKQVSSERGKVKSSDDFNLKKIRVAVVGEIAYGPVKLYASYSLTPLHEYGLEQYPYSVGCRINGF